MNIHVINGAIPSPHLHSRERGGDGPVSVPLSARGYEVVDRHGLVVARTAFPELASRIAELVNRDAGIA